jgi:flavin-dependent dehydrogenase
MGGGPAGATAAALIASEGGKVLVLEKSRFPREKLCGEFISPECFTIFERLGIASQIRNSGAASIHRMDLIAPNGRRVEIPASWFPGGLEGAVGLTRARLDSMLLENARRSGARVLEAMSAASFRRFEEGFEVIARDHQAKDHRFFGRLLVDATGRTPISAHKNLTEPRSSRRERWFAAKVHLRGVSGIASTGELYFFNGGYGGVTAVESDLGGARFNLCFLATETAFKQARGDRSELLRLTLMQNPVARERLREARACDEWLATGPISYGKRVAAAGVISLGDAGAFIDPFTGSGILLALSSAELLASAVRSEARSGAGRPEAVQAKYEEMFGAATRLRFGASALLRSVALSSAGRRLAAPLLASHAGLARLLTRATRHGAKRVVLSKQENDLGFQ